MLTRNIWDHADYHCPIIGTCLTTAELRTLTARVGLDLPRTATDYEVHGAFVCLVKRAGRPAKIVQKYLDRKYKRQLRRMAKAEGDEAAWAIWTELADAGEIPGAFWAAMRLREVSASILAQIYGEVHMLSHLVGASTRADLRRLAEALSRAEQLESALAESKASLHRAAAVWKRRNFELQRECSVERARREKAERERISLRELLETRGIQEAERERDALLKQHERLQDHVIELEAQNRRQSAIIETNYREESALRTDLLQREREVETLELALLEDLTPKTPCGGACRNPEACPCPHLRGKCVLYVGGRSGLKSQYRMLGERFGCELLHHDGGLEQSPQHLQQMLTRADAVVCPVDCVSHEACAAVKRLCRGSMKPVLFARSSGLSSLASSLRELHRVCQ